MWFRLITETKRMTQHQNLINYPNIKKICSNLAVRGFPLSRVLFFPCAFVQQVTTSDSQQQTSLSQKIESKTQRREIVFHVIAI